MIFEERFQALIDRMEGSLAFILMGFDGLSIASVIKPDVDLDLELMGAEISSIVGQLRESSFISQFGMTEEFVLRSKQTTILLKVLLEEYFAAFIIKPDVPVGKARHFLHLVEPEIEKELI